MCKLMWSLIYTYITILYAYVLLCRESYLSIMTPVYINLLRTIKPFYKNTHQQRMCRNVAIFHKDTWLWRTLWNITLSATYPPSNDNNKEISFYRIIYVCHRITSCTGQSRACCSKVDDLNEVISYFSRYLENVTIYCHDTCQKVKSLPQQQVRKFSYIYHKTTLIFFF